ncbi:MAG: hypothetical protein JWL86_799 [Rhizobium sp.]|nr:hypothetical protein [Rhizobium sp.]
MSMKRRSFLALLGLSPLALKGGAVGAVPVTAAPSLQTAVEHPSYGYIVDRSGRCIMGKLTNADGSFTIDFSTGRMEIKGDMICDGQISGKVVEVDPIDGWDYENRRYVDGWDDGHEEDAG